MKTSATIENLATALVAFQSKLHTLGKDSSGYGYKYISLDAVWTGIRDNLAAAGLSVVQMGATPPVEMLPAVALTTRIMHISGEWLEDTMVMPVPQVGKANEAQNFGAALSYARRYALTSALGIVADEDTDAAPVQRPAAPKMTARVVTQGAPPDEPSWDDLPGGNGNGRITNDQLKPTDKQQKALFAMGKSLYGDEWDAKRPELVAAVTKGRSNSAEHLTRAEISQLLDGIKTRLDERESA